MPLHAAWADSLVASGHADAAASHYVEAGDNEKAAGAALAAGNLTRAATLLDTLPIARQEAMAGALLFTSGCQCCTQREVAIALRSCSALPAMESMAHRCLCKRSHRKCMPDLAWYRSEAQHAGRAGELAAAFKTSGNLAQAAAYFVRAGRATAAVHMYLDAGRWDEARKVIPVPPPASFMMRHMHGSIQVCSYACAVHNVWAAVSHMQPIDWSCSRMFVNPTLGVQAAVQYLDDSDQMRALYVSKARALQSERKFKDAERCLGAIDAWSEVEEMYKNAGLLSDYLRVAKRAGNEAATAARLWVAQRREAEGNYRCARVLHCVAS